MSVPEFSFQFSTFVPGETAFGCCPIGFTCAIIQYGQTCHSMATATSFTTASCIDSTYGQPALASVPTTTITRGTASVVTTADLLAPMFQLNQQPTDLGLVSLPTAAPDSTAVTAPSTLAPSSNSTAAPSSTAGVSISAIAAIATVVPLAILAIGGALLAWWWRRRRRQLDAQLQAVQHVDHSSSSGGVFPERTEMLAREELHNQDMRRELEAGLQKAEMARMEKPGLGVGRGAPGFCAELLGR